MARRTDLLDISHHNTISSWDAIPPLPIVHKVCEGGRADGEFAARMPRIKDRTEEFGGYVVLWPNRPGKISIADQMAAYIGLMEPFWDTGAFTQLDCEPWEYLTGRDRVNAAEIVEAHAIHVAAFERPPSVYINPRQMPGVIEEVRESIPDVVFWEPHYGDGGHASAIQNRATLHQWTSSFPCPGFAAGIDANEILDHDELDRVCGLSNAPAPTPPPDMSQEPDAPHDPGLASATLWRHADYADLFLIGMGPIIRVSEELRDSLKTRGVPIVGDDRDDVMLATVLQAAGISRDDLTPR